ncbi:low molecular weight phosphatase family protein [Candidatus Parcubacteria bacterium]|nr:low molecular weight phosphatase family protein [Candidatus Parcubacteria bacterium]
MKVLFVCRNNIARSQIAKAIFNTINKKHTAHAAGTRVKNIGETLRQRSERKGGALALKVMMDNGYDMSGYIQEQVSKDCLNDFDLIVNMAAKRYTPKWLIESPKYIHWKINDPKNRSYLITDNVRMEIESKVIDLSKKML